MPFKPGQSGNPGGRPKESENHKIRVRRFEKASLETLVAALDATKLCGEALVSHPDWKARIDAARTILERGFGKPSQEITGKDGGAIEVNTGGLYERISAAVAGAAIEADEEPTGEPN